MKNLYIKSSIQHMKILKKLRQHIKNQREKPLKIPTKIHVKIHSTPHQKILTKHLREDHIKFYETSSRRLH